MSGWWAGGAVAVLLLPVLVIGAAFGSLGTTTGDERQGIPPVMLDAYRTAAAHSAGMRRGCEVPWAVLAGIGRVESDHGRHWPNATITADGEVQPWIIGPVLDGSGGTAAIADTDDGRWDRDTTWDRAAGPMQFVPSSWQRFGHDANDDGIADPHNLYDATLAAAAHLCQAPAPPAGGKDLSDPSQLRAALYAYNRSQTYVEDVLGWISRYAAATGPAAAGGYSFPVARDLVSPALLARTHHDYPAWDLAVTVGTPTYAAHGGRVTAVTSADSRCGLGLVIVGEDGYSYTYCHASVVHVSVGAVVAAGQPVMASGNTGNSTGPHLHLGIRRPDGRSICPQPLLAAWYAGLPVDPATAPTTGCTH